MRSALYALLLIFPFTACLAETGTNERPVALPVIENLKLINDKNADELKIFQAQMPDNDVVAIYTPIDQSSGLPVTVISKAKGFPIVSEAEWLGSRPAIVEDYKRVAAEKSKHPTANQVNSTMAPANNVSQMRTAVAPEASFQEITPIKSILDRKEAITFINFLKKTKDNTTSTAANAVTMLFVNGNLILLTTSRPFKSDADYDFLSKYNNGFIDKFLAVNPKIAPITSAMAVSKSEPVKSNTATPIQTSSQGFTLHHLRPILVFFPFIILLYILQYFINRGIIGESYKTSFTSLMFSWKGALTGGQALLGCFFAILFYITLFLIPIVYLAMTSIEIFSRHMTLFKSLFVIIFIGLLYSLMAIITKYIRGK